MNTPCHFTSQPHMNTHPLTFFPTTTYMNTSCHFFSQPHMNNPPFDLFQPPPPVDLFQPQGVVVLRRKPTEKRRRLWQQFCWLSYWHGLLTISTSSSKSGDPKACILMSMRLVRINERMNGWMDEWMNGWMNGWTNNGLWLPVIRPRLLGEEWRKKWLK